MFTGDLVDNRTGQQKQHDRLLKLPAQMEMFSTRQVAQFGVRARPVMPYSPGKLVLICEDPRTDEEREADILREAQRLTVPLFVETSGSQPEAVQDTAIKRETESPVEPDCRVALLHLSKADLITSRPDLKKQIEELTDADIQAIAVQAANALLPIYRMVLQISLTAHFS